MSKDIPGRRNLVRPAAQAAALVLVTVCAAIPGSAKQAEQAVTDKRIVDCLLRGEIRKLGTMIYQSPPRPSQLPANECAIRGGEFLLYDRANFASSMAHWLSLGKEGDVNAQVYLGQMFEQGMGLDAPNYPQAAAWYQQAADAGNAVAQINLAQMYEQGKGVEQDQAAAKRLYADAFNIPGAKRMVALDPGTVDDPASTIRKLEKQLADVRGEADTLSAQLRAARADAQEAEHELNAQRKVEARLKTDLANSLLALKTNGGDAKASKAARKDYEDGEKRLQEQQSSIARLQGEIKRNEVQIVNYQGQMQENSSLESALREQTKKYQTANRQLGQARTALNESNLRLEAKKAELEAREVTLGDQSTRLQNLQADVVARQARSKQLQGELAKIRQENEKLLAARKEADRYRRESEQLQAALQAANRQLAEAEDQSLEATEHDSLKEEVTRLQSESERYKARISTLEESQSKAALADLVGPTLHLIEPIATNTRGKQQVSFPETVTRVALVGQVTAPAGLLSLKFNEQLISVNERNVFEVQTELETRSTIARFVAVDNQGKRAERVITLIRAQKPPPEPKSKRRKVNFGKFHALLIGNENYSALSDLKTPKEDIHELDEILRNRYGFETTLIEDGTREQIMDGMYKLLSELTSDDNLLIYYAGHGEYVKDTSRGVWLPVDANPNSPANWISNVEISDYLKQISAKQIIVIADSCYSGALTRSAMINVRPGLTEDEYTSQLKRMSKKLARVVLTSGGLAPVLDSATPGAKHSIFATALLDVLRENTDILSGQDLSRTLAAKVSYAAEQVGYEQEPQYAPLNHTNHQGGDFYFVPQSL